MEPRDYRVVFLIQIWRCHLMTSPFYVLQGKLQALTKSGRLGFVPESHSITSQGHAGHYAQPAGRGLSLEATHLLPRDTQGRYSGLISSFLSLGDVVAHSQRHYRPLRTADRPRFVPAEPLTCFPRTNPDHYI